ncbi:MAG: hypothetical protein M5R42_20135 [Rhodocyclaceae bacterium]|nr:hypothetical protein [Rhodocyclaceae bacterium]
MPNADLPSHLSRENVGSWETYLEQVERVAPHLDRALLPWIETLRRPKRSLIVDVPIKLDNGEVAHFEGYRVHHNLSRGPGKGGIRFHPDVTLSEVMALSRLDDHQERRGAGAFRRRQGRRARRPQNAFARRTRAPHPPLRQRTQHPARPRP